MSSFSATSAVNVVRVDTTASSGDAAALGANRQLVLTFEIGPLYNIPAAGLANVMARYYSRLHVDATAQLDGLDWSHRPGDLWSYTAPISGVGTGTSMCHTVERDLFTRQQSVQLGVPPAQGIISITRRVYSANGGPGGSGGDGSTTGVPTDPAEGEIATVTRTITGPNDEEIPGAFFAVGTLSAPSGASLTVPAGEELRLVYFVPPDFVPPPAEDIELEPDEVDEEDVEATYRKQAPFTPVVFGGPDLLIFGGKVRDGVQSVSFSDYIFQPNNNDFVWLSIAVDSTTRAWSAPSWGAGSTLPTSTGTEIIFKICRVAVSGGMVTITEREPAGDIFVREYIVLINGELFYEYVPVRTDLVLVP